MLQRAIELSEYGIKYQSRLPRKGQVMTEFIVELPQKHTRAVDRPGKQWWILHVDGASRVSRSKVSLVLQSPTRKLIEQAIRLSFSTSNNEVEYKVVLVGLDLALMLTATKLEIRIDSQLIVRQIQQEYEAKDERMARYLAMVEEHLKKLDKWIIRRVPRDVNAKVDALAMIATTLPRNGTIMLPIYLKVTPSITLGPICSIGQTDSRWMFNIIKYLQTGDVPEDEKQSHNLHIQIARFTFN
ncbi:hypothetical protein CK203_057332 [Vitis vinifera]|uniref:RNase H type-1 domain-containing protein n=1 Tax=Vitis vinifera TaxID=29760 RepID=A0A438GLU9_VITVI|nr:hypothetical protein CK203_057332 [Vitis vinifera]